MDGSRFKTIFLPFHGKLYRIAYRYLGNQSDAEDVVQETYIKLWQKRNELEALINPEGFSVAVLKNSCLDCLRKVKCQKMPLNDLSAIESTLASEQIERREEIGYIQMMVKKLPVQQQQIIEMKIWNNLSDKEIEQQTGYTKGNIKVMMSRARRKIKEHYKKWEQDECRRII